MLTLLALCETILFATVFAASCSKSTEKVQAVFEGSPQAIPGHHLPNRTNLSTHILNITYVWKIDEQQSSVDGFFYCFHDEDLYLSDDSSEDQKKINCSSYLGMQLWMTSKNGTYIQCSFPCEDTHGKLCKKTSICNTKRSDCARTLKPLPRDARNITIAVAFGRLYYFQIIPYIGQRVGMPSEDVFHLSTLCGTHFVDTLGLAREISYDFCETEQQVSEAASAAAPNNLTIKITPNFVNKTYSIVLKWRPLHKVDIIGNHTVKTYTIIVHYDNFEEMKEAEPAKSAEEERREPYYYHTLYDVDPEYQPYITVHAELQCARGLTCSSGLTASIQLSKLRVCSGETTNNGLCGEHGNCSESKTHNPFDFTCACQKGYHTEGENMSDGLKCVDFDSCKFSQNAARTVCDPNALCIDDEPPSIDFTCECQSGYFGDGYPNGSGCIKITILIVAFGVGISAALVIIVLLIVWKRRERKLRSTTIRYSKYVAGQAISSSGLLLRSSGNDVEERTQLRPAFGEKWELKRATILLQEVIGRGNFGVVRSAYLADDLKTKVAVKSLTDTTTNHLRDTFLAEMSLLISLGSHENIIGVIGVCTKRSATDDENLSPLLVTEYMTYGDLLHFLWDAREPEKREFNPVYNFTENSLYSVGQQVANALLFLTNVKVIHGDVAARNILVGENFQCKLSDFGLANDVYRYGMIKGATERRVPFKWVSPERMMEGKVPITWRSDVWSFGILLYEMVTLGAAPYPGKKQQEIFDILKDGYRIPQPPSCSDKLYHLMMECWQWDALKRPTFSELKCKLARTCVSDDDGALERSSEIQPLDENAKMFYQDDITRRKENADNNDSTSLQSSWPSDDDSNRAVFCEGDIPVSFDP